MKKILLAVLGTCLFGVSAQAQTVPTLWLQQQQQEREQQNLAATAQRNEEQLILGARLANDREQSNLRSYNNSQTAQNLSLTLGGGPESLEIGLVQTNAGAELGAAAAVGTAGVGAQAQGQVYVLGHECTKQSNFGTCLAVSPRDSGYFLRGSVGALGTPNGNLSMIGSAGALWLPGTAAPVSLGDPAIIFADGKRTVVGIDPLVFLQFGSYDKNGLFAIAPKVSMIYDAETHTWLKGVGAQAYFEKMLTLKFRLELLAQLQGTVDSPNSAATGAVIVAQAAAKYALNSWLAATVTTSVSDASAKDEQGNNHALGKASGLATGGLIGAF